MARGSSPLVSIASIPPIEPYLSRRRRSPDDHAVQLAFAAVLFERELYYTALYRPHGPCGDEPPPSHVAAWLPYPATEAGQAALRARRDLTLHAAALPPYDLFGLKTEALRGLRKTIGSAGRKPLGALLASAFSADLGEHEAALDLALAVLAAHPGHKGALARAADVALSVAQGEPRAGSQVRALERQARSAFGEGWMSGLARAKEAQELQIRRVAWRARADVEGERFTRFLRTDRQFCEEERDRAMVGFDPARVPPGLRELIPVAHRFGVGDDVCRDLFIQRTTARERREILRLSGPCLEEAQAWVATFDPASFPPEVAAFFWLLEALESMRDL